MKKLTSILLSILLTLSSISPTFALEVTEENNLNSDEIVTENIDNTESQKDSILEEEEKQENSSKEEQSSTKTKPKSTEVKQKVEEKSTEKEEKVEESSKESTSDSINNETVNDETVNDLTGNYSEIDDVEAISLYNEAAENKEDAIDVLIDELSFPKKDAKKVAEDLFDIKGNRALTKGDNDEEDVPRQGDGSNIENISAKWITDDTVDNGDSSLLYYKPSGDNSFDVRLQINYALSGEHNYEPGDITITIPENIFKNRADKYACEVILPYPEDPSTKADFNWKLVDGNYVLTNTKRMSAATKGYIQIGFAGLTPHDLVDMEVSEDFDAYIEVTTHKGNLIALRSNKLNAQFDTEAKLVNNSVRKSNRTVERVPASEIPANQRINGEEEYILVTWYVYGSTTANTWYTLDSIDSIPQNASVTNNLKESDVHGFIIGATSGNGIELTKDNMYHGYSSGQTSYYSFKTAYPASQFEPNVVYTFHNKIHMTVTEDDPAAEVTNPNVQAEDPKLITEGEYTAQTTWSYRLPKWNNPTGHFMVCKNGNDNKVGNNQTHHNIHPGGSYSDIHIWKNKSPIDSWYGIYPSGMNDLDEGKDMYLSYTIDSVGYTMPWMFNEASYETDGELAARKAINYNLPVTMITEDTGVRLGSSKQKLTVHEDFEFVSIEFPPTPYVYTGKPKNINPDGSWEALTAGDGTFEYKLDSNYSHYPDITLEIYRNGGWEEYAVASWKTGSIKITLANGDVVSGAIVDLPSDTENFRTQVTVQNTLDENLSNVISQAAIDYDVRPVIKLYDTDVVKALVTAGFEATHTPSMYVYNGVNMKAYDSNNAEIVSIDKEGRDVLRGYTTDVTVYPSKTVRQTLKDADYVNRQVTLHYSAKVEERSVINDKKTYEQAVVDGRLAVETHGFWYDLLPKGVTPNISSIKLRSGDKVLSARTEENYKNSGRTLLIVEVELQPTPERYRSGDMYYYEDVPSISFDAWYAFDALTDYGKSIHNVIAFESSNDHIGTMDGYSGEPDNPNTGEDNNVSTHLAFSTNDEKTWMTDLDEERNDPSFVYAGVSNTIDIISAARLSLQKDVMVNNDGRWGTGVFNSDLTPEGGEPSYTYNENSKAENEMVVWEGGLYSYKLRMMPDDETRAKDMVIYDSLETFKAGDGNEPIDEIAANENATWQGKFMGVDVSQLVDIGCAPVVYYSTIPNLALSDETNPEMGNRANMLFNEDNTINSSVWIRADQYDGDLSAVTAIAVDASKKADESDFTLEPLESIVVLINMRAPSDDETRDIIANNGPWGTSAYAYNNAYLTGTTIDIDTLDEDSDNFVRKDYTKVGLVEYQYNVKKVWNDDNNRDGIRPENITVHLLADGTDTGESLLLDADNNWKASFEHIPYTTPDGKKIKYSVLEDEVTNYSTDITGSEASSTITNSHVPEKISLTINKNWRNDTEQDRPDYITIELYGNGKKVTSKRIDASTNWTCTFTDLFKNENGIPIRYTAKETFPNGDVKHLSYIASEPDGLVLVGLLTPDATPDFSDPLSIREDEDHVFTNTYHPYGDLYVNKNVTNVTSVSTEQDFEFTFAFSINEDGEDVPVFDEYDYDVLDGTDHVVSSGKISNNGTISIKGGQRIHVKEIDEYVKYKVTEKEEEGFKQVNATNTEGIVSPNSDVIVSFDNDYSAKGNFNPVVEKILKNRELRKYQFKFEMYQIFEEQDDNGTVTTTENLIRTATSGKPDDPVLREDGTIESSHAMATFGAIKYTQEDANTQVELGKPYRYKIVEVKSDKAGYTYDETVYYVDVAVTDNGDGTLNIVPTYYKEIPPEEGGILDGLGDLIFGEDDPTYEEVENPVFVNGYKAEGEIVLRAWKDLQGRKLTDGEFEFELLDENGQPVYKVNPETGEPTDEPMTATNTEDGSIVFEALKFDEKDIGKTFTYGVREKKGSDNTINYNTDAFGYTIDVLDNGDGTLSFSQGFAAPIIEEFTCNKCNGDKYVIDETHPYQVCGYLSVNDYGDYASVTSEASIAGPSLDYTLYRKRDTTLSSDEDRIGSGYWGWSSGYGNTSEILRAYNLVADILTLSGVYNRVNIQYGDRNQIIDDNATVHYENNVWTVLYEDKIYDLIRKSDYGWTRYYLAEYPVCDECNGEGTTFEITGWNTEEGDLPVFTNTLKEGNLSVTKKVTNPENANMNQKFKFKVKLIGDNVEDKQWDYKLDRVNNREGFTVHITDSKTGNPISGVGVTFTNNYWNWENDTSTKYYTTDNEGCVVFDTVDPGQYFFWINSVPSDEYDIPMDNYNNRVTKMVTLREDGSGDVVNYNIWNPEVTDVYTYEWVLEKKEADETGKSSRNIKTNKINDDLVSTSETTPIVKNDANKLMNKIIPPVYAASIDLSNYPAEEAVVQESGTWGTVKWEYYSDNTLVFSPVSGDSGTFNTMTYSMSNQPRMGWCKLNTNVRNKTKRVKFTGGTIYSRSGLSSMFYGLSNLETIDFTNFNTSAAIDMSYMFFGTKVHNVDFTKLNTDNVTDMSHVFESVQSVDPLDLTGLNTYNVTNMFQMFDHCYNMTSLDVSMLDTSNCTIMKSMFSNCQHMKNLNIGQWNTSKVYNMESMFSGCSALESLDITSFDTSHVTRMSSMFSGCESLQTIDLSHFSTNSARNLDALFSRCSNLTSIDVSTFNTGMASTMEYMFQSCSSLKNLDVSNFDTSHCTNANSMFRLCSGLTELKLPNFTALTNMGYMFEGCSSLTQLDVSKIDTKNVTSLYRTFNGCSSLEEIDFSDWDMRKATNLYEMLNNCNLLKRVVLGELFIFIPATQNSSPCFLPTPPSELQYTGKWIKEDNAYGPYTPEKLSENYTSSMEGAWVWEEDYENYVITFNSEEGASGAMPVVRTSASENYSLPACQFKKFGYLFDHWDDGNNHTYQDKDTISAGTYEATGHITLTAVFVPRDTTANMENGEFEFELYGGEKATFERIPAGTAYQVYEETPDGWVLIEQGNTSGKIEPLETSEAVFKNKYEPGTTTAQFFGTKTLDGQAAEVESYSFILDETTEGASGTVTMLVDGEEQNVELPYTVTVSEGGFIQFPAIKYSIDDIGEHTYMVREVNPNDEHIDYDMHVETIKVNVTGDVTELKAETIIDEDGDSKISFANKTRPGELRITKNGQNVTDVNKEDEFTFKVTLNNDKGLPLSDEEQIYWYKTDTDGNIIQNEAINNNIENPDSQNNANHAVNQNQKKINLRSDNLSLDTDNITPSSDENVVSLSKAPLAKSGETRSVEPVSGTCGTCSWSIDEEGVLRIWPSNGTSGTLISLESSYAPWWEYRKNVTKVIVSEGVVASGSCRYMFQQFINCTEMDLNGLDMHYVTSVYGMFDQCTSLTSISFPNWDTSNVQYWSYFLHGCENLTSVDLTGLDTSNATSFGYMFYQCKNLSATGVSSLDTAKLGYADYMFAGCSSLTSVDLSSWNTSNLQNMGHMFGGCTNLTSMDLSVIDTSSVRDMQGMFVNCTSLTSYDMTGVDTSNVRYMTSMFSGCSNLTSLNLSSMNTSKVTDMSYMFHNCSSLTSLDLSNFVTTSVTRMQYMFSGCISLSTLNLRGWNTKNVQYRQYMFEDCRSMTGVWDLSVLYVSRLPINSNIEGMFKGCSGVTRLIFHMDCRNARSLAHMFDGCENLESISNYLDIDYVTNTSYMFRNCAKLQNPSSYIQDANPTNVSYMFDGCSSMNSFDTSRIKLSSVTNMTSMFANCTSLTALDLSSLPATRVKYLDNTFAGCTNLQNLNIEKFDTTASTSLKDMFAQCNKLSSITLGESFSFQGAATTEEKYAILPDPPEELPYLGTWIRTDDFGPYTAQELQTNYDSDYAGTWIWEVYDPIGYVIFYPNEGIIIGNDTIAAEEPNTTITLLDSSNVQRHHYILTGWNTKADGTGDHYDAGAEFVIPMEQKTKLYAEWEDSHKRDYTVIHYQQNLLQNGYVEVDRETTEAEIGSEITPAVKDYTGFIAPELQTFEMPENDDTVIEYRYNRGVYAISYDGNGSTFGQMNNQNVVWGNSVTLNKNVYQKTGSIFTGWNTEADGRGDNYPDMSTVSNLSNENGAVITLYAQWMDNPNEALIPANGEIYVKCKAGESIVIPNLPAGTKYTVEEVDMADGWTQTGIVGENGTIVANQTNTATVNNRYEATGELQLKAHKSMPGNNLEGGEFTFELKKYDSNIYNYVTIGTATNEATDKITTITNEEGEDSDNPWYNTAPITFPKMTFTQDDIGKTYIYLITEKRDGDSKITYDIRSYYAYVTVKDLGNGMLGFDVEYSSGDEPVFVNYKATGKLSISKEVQNTSNAVNNEEFEFIVELKDAKGNPLKGEYPLYHHDGIQRNMTKIFHTNNLNDEGEKEGEFADTQFDIALELPGVTSYNLFLKLVNPRGIMFATKKYYSQVSSGPGSYLEPEYYINDIFTSSQYDTLIEYENVIDGNGFSLFYWQQQIDPSNPGYNQWTNYGVYGKIEAAVDFESSTIKNGDIITLKDGEYAEIDKLPDGTTYTITEVPKENWSLVSAQDPEGSIQAGATSHAQFVNADNRIPETPEGQAQLHTKKTLIGGTIKDEDGFVFELLDENGEIIQSKNVDQIGSSSSDITFDPISYTEADAAVPVEYHVQAMMMKDGESVPRVITLDTSTYETVVNGTKMNVSGTFTWDDEVFAGCDRSQVVISAVPKDNTYSEYTKQLAFDMSDKNSVEFSFNNLEKYVGGQYHYTIREQAGSDDHIKYDSAIYGAKVTVIDSGEGYLQTSVEYEKGDDVVSEAEFKNTRLTDIHIIKKDADTLEIISDAKFIIKSADNKYLHSDGTLSDEIEEFITDSQGRIDVDKVPAGTYTLHETEAPGGYTLAEDIVFSVDEEGVSVNHELVEEVLVLEELGTHDITLGKSVSGNMGNTNDRFIFIVQFTGDIIPDQLVSTFRYADGRVSTHNITVGESKTLRVALHHNESVTWSGIPHGAEYTITEEAADRNGYVTSATAQIGTVGADKVVRGTLTDNESVTYINTCDILVLTGGYMRNFTFVILILLLISALYIKRNKLIDIIKHIK